MENCLVLFANENELEQFILSIATTNYRIAEKGILYINLKLILTSKIGRAIDYSMANQKGIK